MRIEADTKLDYNDVLIRPKRSTLTSRSRVDLVKKYTFRNSGQTYTGIPIMAANMHGVGTFGVMYAIREHGLFTCLIKDYVLDDFDSVEFAMPSKSDTWALSTGITESDLDKTHEIIRHVPVKYLCVDVANGYSEKFIDTVQELRERYPCLVIIAGNVVTPDITEELILRGADIVKVGIGPGSVCTTRVKTGVGYPQLSAVIECADAAHGLGGHIIADGGCSTPGDIAKAFGAGADFVMLGGMLAGTDQGGGEVSDGKVTFYGMSSQTAQEKTNNVKDYRASEGRVVQVPYRGDITPIVGDILGGLRSSCTYVGALSLKELPKRTTFIRVNNTHNRVYEQYTIGE